MYGYFEYISTLFLILIMYTFISIKVYFFPTCVGGKEETENSESSNPGKSTNGCYTKATPRWGRTASALDTQQPIEDGGQHVL